MNSSEKLPVLAKSSGITLAAHENHVWDQAVAILEQLPFLATKHYLLTGKQLSPSLERAIVWHDKGKRHSQWQGACRKDYQLYQQWRIDQGLDPDVLNQKEYQQYEKSCLTARKPSGPHLMKAGLRHEMASLAYAHHNLKEQPLTITEVTAIAAHHGKLNPRHEHRWQSDGGGKFYEYWKGLRKYAKEFGMTWSSDEVLKNSVLLHYEFAALRSLLQLADTRASREESEGTDALPPINPFSYSFPHKNEEGSNSLRPVQASALACAEAPVSVLRAPTGSGKTDASLLWGTEQIRQGKADRLVIAMPTRFTSNALTIGIKESVSDTGLYHSSAWFNRFGADLNGPDRSNAVELHKLAQKLVTPVSVCTIDHLLMCLTGTQEVHHTTFFFLANAAVVFDEVDFYDPFIQANIKVLLDVLRILKVPVLIMSATVPNSALTFYGINTKITEPKPEASKPNRSLRLLGNIDKPILDNELPKTVTDVFQKMIAAENGIVYANTTLSGLVYYEWLRKKTPDDLPIVFYHSRFTEPDKKAKEEQLIKSLGKEAWKSGTARGITIMTQIGEMSINISSQLMYSELCPWDRLAQRVGRLSRFVQVPSGVCYIAVLVNNKEVYPAPYGSLEGGKWQAGRAILETLKRITTLLLDKGNVRISSEDFVREVNLLYPSPESLSTYATTNQEALRKHIYHNWLMVPHTATDEDQGYAGDWKARDIMPQETFMVGPPEGYDLPDKEDKFYYPFRNYEAFRSYQLEHGVTCPKYLIEKALKLGHIQPFQYTIGDDSKKQEVFTCYIANNYSKNIGLAALGIGSIANDSEDEESSSGTSTESINRML